MLLTWTAPDLGSDPHPVDRILRISAHGTSWMGSSILERAVLKGGGSCSLTGEDDALLRPEELRAPTARQPQSCF